MSNFNIEFIFLNAANMAVINSVQAVMQERYKSHSIGYEAALIAKRQNAEHLKQVEIFNSRTKS